MRSSVTFFRALGGMLVVVVVLASAWDASSTVSVLESAPALDSPECVYPADTVTWQGIVPGHSTKWERIERVAP